MAMKRILVLGVGGFVGKYLARELLSHNYVVFGSDIGEKAALPEKVEYKCADLLDTDSVRHLFCAVRPDAVINLAAISSVGASWENPQKTIAVNVIGALNVLEAARNCEARPKVMFIGSSEEYLPADEPLGENAGLDANNPYGVSKIAQENFARIYRDRYHMEVCCVRPFNHTGVGQRDTFVLPSFCRQAAEIEKSGKPGTIKVGNLEARRDFSDVRDIVRAYRMIIEDKDCKTIYNIGSGKVYGLREMLDYVISLSRQKITVEIDPLKFRPVDTPVICCDNSLIKKNIGWEPEHNVFETLREMFEYYVGEQ